MVDEYSSTLLVVRQPPVDRAPRVIVVCGATNQACSGGTPAGVPVAVSACVAVEADHGSLMESVTTLPW